MEEALELEATWTTEIGRLHGALGGMNMKLFLPVIVSFVFLETAFGGTDGFDIQLLPKGKDVTLPVPAVTYVPVTEQVRLSSTDLPQAIKLSMVAKKGARNSRPVKLGIYDSGSERVQFVTIQPGASFLYNFHSLGSVSLVPQGVEEFPGNDSSIQMRVESDKPLNIAR